MPSVHIVIRDDIDREHEVFGFYREDDAESFSAVRGGCNVYTVRLFDEAEARRLIGAEAKERRDEERFDRMRDEGEI